MGVQHYSTNPDNNTSISGTSVAEGCPAGNINNAFRQMMADIAVMYAAIPSAATFVTKTGGVFTGNPTFNGAGGYLFHASSANTGGRITIQPSGGPAPAAPQNGDLWGEY